MSRIEVNPFGSLRRLQERGFSNQQALLLLLLVFPIGLVGLGFAILLIQRQGVDHSSGIVSACPDCTSQYGGTTNHNSAAAEP